MLYLTEEISRKAIDHLTDLLVGAEAEAVYLCDKGGNIVVSKTTTDYHNEDNIAALAAGSFSATNALAGLLGEPGFHCIFHQSDNLSMYLHNLEDEMLLLVLFGPRSNPGLVRLHSDEFSHAIRPMVESMTKSKHFIADLQDLDLDSEDTDQPFTKAQ